MESTLNTLDETITQLMSTAHHEVAQRKRGNITVKLHNLESHVVPWIGRFWVGLGVLAELCADSINTMSVVNTLQRKSDRQTVHIALYFATARRRQFQRSLHDGLQLPFHELAQITLRLGAQPSYLAMVSMSIGLTFMPAIC